MVTRADIVDVYVFGATEGVIFPLAPDEIAWPRIRTAWDAFAPDIAEKRAPPLTDRNTRVRDDSEWLEAAAKYLALRTAYDELSAKCDEAKARLTGLATHAKEQGGGISVTRVWRRGSVDYKLVPELLGVDLEPYRGSPREEVRVLLRWEACFGTRLGATPTVDGSESQSISDVDYDGFPSKLCCSRLRLWAVARPAWDC